MFFLQNIIHIMRVIDGHLRDTHTKEQCCDLFHAQLGCLYF